MILFETDVFYDSDCLSCFLAVRECGSYNLTKPCIYSQSNKQQ